MARLENQLYWSLSQAAAWVVFRDMALVDRFFSSSPDDWSAFMAYPSMRRGHAELGTTGELFGALRNGRLTAFGRRRTPGATVEEIPVIEWQGLIPDIKGPFLRRDGGAREVPWLDVRIKRADVERLWRRPSETEGRSRYPKSWFQERYVELRALHPSFSQNKIIEELEAGYQEETRRVPPSRTSIQRYIKGL
jgi:hypothetical protein